MMTWSSHCGMISGLQIRFISNAFKQLALAMEHIHTRLEEAAAHKESTENVHLCFSFEAHRSLPLFKFLYLIPLCFPRSIIVFFEFTCKRMLPTCLAMKVCIHLTIL